jgi:AhpD family alkylhydroperoxidase
MFYGGEFMVKKTNFFEVAPKAMGNLIRMENYFRDESTIDPIIKELIKIRASQINGCAYCLNMHTIDALKIGETQQRIFLVSAWWETELFTPKEKAVLNLTEHITQVSEKGVPTDVLDEVFSFFDEKEFVDLVLMINQINSWNRINIATHNDIDKDYK